MKYFREVQQRIASTDVCFGAKTRACMVVLGVVVGATGAIATVEWSGVPGQSREDGALYRVMQMPVRSVLGPRPPKESTPLLSQLIKEQATAELHVLRARQEEAGLDFAAAEADWKRHAEIAKEKTRAQFDLADFYHRRLRPNDEIAALSVIAGAPATASDRMLSPGEQSSWLAFERMEKTIRENALGPAVYETNFRQWVARYPEQKQVYARYLEFLLQQKEFAAVEKLVADYRAKFPDDGVFAVKARALLAYRRGSTEQGLAVYDKEFQPLWPAELVQSYFDLLDQTRSTRIFVDKARSALERNPNDLNAAARLFYYYEHIGRADAAQQTLISLRAQKERRNATWSPDDLYSIGRLNEAAKNYPEAARNYYALYSAAAKDETRGQALAALIKVLLDAPQQPMALGSGNLAMYRDIATMDTGPGYLNGILSLVLNSTAPASAYSEEENNATPYFHHAEAAELLRLLDTRYPSAPERATLHASLLQVFANYGENEAVIRDSQKFLSSFTAVPERTDVALLLADAFARTNRQQDEFKVYDTLLAELAKKSAGVPLGLREGSPSYSAAQPDGEVTSDRAAEDSDGAEDGQTRPAQPQNQRAFAVNDAAKQEQASGPRSPAYSRVLERYLSRLVSSDQAPSALMVLRREIENNPDDPGLYERLAQFLDQNRLGEQQEQVYQRAIQKFDGTGWYHKLARFYLRQKRDADFTRLSEQVINTFSGSELEQYFGDVVRPGDFYVQLNEFAHRRFPHDLAFVRNLLSTKKVSAEEHEELLREHWWEADDLRDWFFEYLSRTGKLEVELAALKRSEASEQRGDWRAVAQSNPVATHFVAEASFWASHFEEGAPAMAALAGQFPADRDLGRRASAVYRSLAAFDSRDTETAVAIEENLYRADPGNR